MTTHSNNGWKSCSRGHKYRGSRCTICWKGAVARPPKRGEPTDELSGRSAVKRRAHPVASR